MKTLNLVYPEKSDIKYIIQKFPDGQRNIVLNEVRQTHDVSGKYLLKESGQKWEHRAAAKRYPWRISSRLNNWQDLELIVASVASLRGLGVKEIHLYTPYFMGARSDRKFEDGGNNYLKDVICPIINSLNFESVTVLDPHSDVLEACINNFKKIGISGRNSSLVNWAIRDLYDVSDNTNYPHVLTSPFILISPDAGAQKKIHKVAEQIAYIGDIITCSKYRDETGKLSKVNVPINATHLNKDFIIIDDICDGGATFNNIAYQIKLWDTTNSSKIYLIVTHGIFSKGYGDLSRYFDKVYCTNSYSNTLKGSFFNYDTTDLVKQLNVF